MFICKLGKQGNVERLEKALSRAQSAIATNKIAADAAIEASEEGTVEIAAIVSDLCDAVTELAEIIAGGME